MKKIAILCFLCISCFHEQEARSVDTAYQCEPACKHAQSLNCKESEDAVYPIECSVSAECPDGICVKGKCTETCEMLCRKNIINEQHQGLECWSKITSCEQLVSCAK